MTESDTMSAAEVAARFSVTPRTLLKYADAGQLPFRAIKFGRVSRFSRLDVEAALGMGRRIEEPGPMRAVRGGAVVEVR
jgi:excisionase family DNA binding protein